jgi:hypothetical protein
MLSPIHCVILRRVRAEPTIAASITALHEWDDEQLARRLFLNYRAGGGLRLTHLGHQILQRCFESFSFSFDPQPAHLMYLDTHAKLPYFADKHLIVVYDPLFAVQLRLLDGNLGALVEIDSFR